MKFERLVKDIQHTSDHLQQNAVKAINIHITLRNWIVGYFIVEFEQKGEDRATYGSKLLQELAEKINIKGLTAPELSRCRQFYYTYPKIAETMSSKLGHLIPARILGTLSQESPPILGTLTQEFQVADNEEEIESHLTLLTTISYSHFSELIKIEDELKRKFYELVILKTTPSVRELKRQIETLAYERAGLSSDKKLAFDRRKKLKISSTTN